MSDSQALQGKKILIVDDEPDILESLEEFLDICRVDSASDFQSASDMLENGNYDAAVLDIMGVGGYDLLELAVSQDIPAVMLTAHALSADNLVKSLNTGAHAYVPKDSMEDIAFYVADAIRAGKARKKGPGKWFSRLRPFFDRKFGPGWMDQYQNIWD